MTKTISIYAAQILLGVIAIAAGYAKLTGSGLMVHQFQVIGLGQGFLTIAGIAEIIAGLCLLMPRGGILGALLLTSVMVGALGVTLGHVASAAPRRRRLSPRPLSAGRTTPARPDSAACQSGSEPDQRRHPIADLSAHARPSGTSDGFRPVVSDDAWTNSGPRAQHRPPGGLPGRPGPCLSAHQSRA